MSEAVKKLTVSYGAFSCTLEGFDDPFPVMKMVVDYFQNLADRDPSFGAHPERPDSEYLRKLAQRGTNHGVEVEAQENGVILRQTGEQASAAAARPVTLSLVPRTETETSDLLFPADAIVETVYESAPQEVGSFGPEAEAADAVEREELALQRLLSAARLRSGTEETLAPANPLSQLKGSAEDQPSMSGFDDAPLAGSMPMPDADFVAEFLEPDVAAIPAAPAAQEPEPVVAVSEPQPEPVFEPATAEPDSAPVFAEAAPEPELPVAAAEMPGEPASDDRPDVIAMSGFAVAHVEAEPDMAAAETAAMMAELSGSAADALETFGADPVQPETLEAMPEDTPSTETLFAEPAEAVDVVEPAEALAEDEPAATEPAVEIAAEAVPEEIEPVAATETAPEITDEVEAEAAPVAETPDVSALVAPLPEFDWQATENGNGNGHNGHNGNGYNHEAEIAPAPMPVLVLGAALRIIEAEEPVAEAEVDVVVEAVAEAETGAADFTVTVEPVAEAEPEAADLPAAAIAADADDAEPLPEPAPRRTIHRARPEAVDFGYAAEQPDAPLAARRGAEDFDDSSITDPDALSLGKFARKVGAASLPELLEASAAYVTIVSGQPRFSRASILNMVDEISDERSYTQEARIKSFGKLLRNGSILRVEDGKFAISHSAKFNYEVKISA